jgi:hypothetical protein
MEWLATEYLDRIKSSLICLQVYGHTLAVCQVIRCLGNLRKNYALIVSRESCLELYLVGDEWMLFEE